MIVVTTPTGAIGAQLIRHLLAVQAPVRVIARDPAALPTDVRDHVQVVHGSHSDARVVQQAFQGADAVFWVVPPNPQAPSLKAAYLDFSQPAVEAIRAENVGHVVTVSSLGRHRPQGEHAGLLTAAMRMDDLIASSGAAVRALTMPSFMENLLGQVGRIRSQGRFSGVIAGDLKQQHVATRDIAAVAASLLVERTWSGVADVPVLGPEELSAEEMATIMTEVLDRAVHYERTPLKAFESGLVTHRGHTEAMAQAMTDMMAAIQAGIYSHEPTGSSRIRPTSFRQWCQDVLRPAIQEP